MNKPKKFIFITGGVLSSLGKGISGASLGMLLAQRGVKVGMVKMDPYLNLDPGTMSPFQHGEVFVLDDGAETDLDLGHYYRFVPQAHYSRKNSFTTGRIYDAVLKKERQGGYLGQTIQVIPHITDEIKRHILNATQESELTIVEVGGTVGDIESLPFLEAIRQMKYEHGGENVLYIHVTLVPYVQVAHELKTKPTQHSVKELREIGIQPDILLCRTDRKLPKDVKEKIGLFCNIPAKNVFSNVDVKTIYEVPLLFKEEGLDETVCEMLGMWTQQPVLTEWKEMVQRVKNPQGEVLIGIVGKYITWEDSYKSIAEALIHGGAAHNIKISRELIDSEELEQGNEKAWENLRKVDGLLVPGGFGERGVEGKIKAIQYARENKIPFFGICLGLQLAVIEFARNCCSIKEANSAEFKPEGKNNVIDLMESQKKIESKGGTMRLGAYPCEIQKNVSGVETKAYKAYAAMEIKERHRHRFEVSNQFRAKLEKHGLMISGTYSAKNQEGQEELVEIIEINDHPWFLGCQFHPEFLSHLLKPHPLFRDFVGASKEQKEKKVIDKKKV